MTLNIFRKSKTDNRGTLDFSFSPTENNLSNCRDVEPNTNLTSQQMLERAGQINSLENPADIRTAFIGLVQEYRSKFATTPDEEIYQYHLFLAVAKPRTISIIKQLLVNRIEEMEKWYDLTNDDIIIANTWLPNIMDKLGKVK